MWYMVHRYGTWYMVNGTGVRYRGTVRGYGTGVRYMGVQYGVQYVVQYGALFRITVGRQYKHICSVPELYVSFSFDCLQLPHLATYVAVVALR